MKNLMYLFVVALMLAFTACGTATEETTVTEEVVVEEVVVVEDTTEEAAM